MASSAEASVASSTIPVEAVTLREPDRADVQAEGLVDAVPVADRELRAAAAGVEDDERAVSGVQRRDRPGVGQPGFVLTGDHLDLDPGLLAHGIDEGGAVGGDPQSRRPDGRDLLDVLSASLRDHSGDRRRGPRDRAVAEPPGRMEVLAKSRDLGTVHDRPPRTIRSALLDPELDRVRADVDHGVAPRTDPGHRLELARHAHIAMRVQPELAQRVDHARRILRLQTDRPRVAVVGSQLRALDHAAGDGVVRTPLVHLDREQVRARRDHFGDELDRAYTRRGRACPRVRRARRASRARLPAAVGTPP